MKNLKLSGLLLFLAGSIALMGIITAEAFYPAGYSTRNSEISDLGSTVQPNSVIFHPSADIFNATMLTAGLLVLAATFLQHKHLHKLVFSIPLGLFGLGLTGIGLFPGNMTPYHGIFSLLTFTSGGIAVISSCKVVAPPFKWVAIAFGAIALTTFLSAIFMSKTIFAFIGDGGTERWVAYPILLWLTGFGGYLMNATTETEASSTR